MGIIKKYISSTSTTTIETIKDTQEGEVDVYVNGIQIKSFIFIANSSIFFLLKIHLRHILLHNIIDIPQ